MINEAIIPAKDVPDVVALAEAAGKDALANRLRAYAASPGKVEGWRSEGEFAIKSVILASTEGIAPENEAI